MRRRLSLLLCLLILLCACAPAAPAANAGLVLWFPAAREDLSAGLSSVPYDGADDVSGLMAALLAGPGPETGLAPAVPAGVELLDWTMEGRVVRVVLSGGYGALKGIDRTLADYCVTLTLSQLTGVDGVRVAVDGAGETGVLRPGDVVFSGAEEEPVEVPARLYFRLGSGGRLGYELRVFRLTEEAAPAKVVLEALCAGPEDEGLTPLLPEGVTVRAAWIDGGVCFADLSSAFLTGIPDSREEQELVISSVVDTLCSLDAVNQVQILIEGETAARYGQVDLSAPLLPGTE